MLCPVFLGGDFMSSNGPLRHQQLLSQKQNLSLAQLQQVKILQMSTPELNQYLYEYQLENPVVELAPSVQTHPFSDKGPSPFALMEIRRTFEGNRTSPAEERAMPDQGPVLNIEHETLEQYLLSQFDLSLAKVDLQLLLFLVHSLDNAGYLCCTDEEAAAATGADIELVREGIAYLQSLDPPGIGARDLGECLCIQLHRRGITAPEAYLFAQEHLGDLAVGRYQKIAQALGISVDEVKHLSSIIRQLSPRPAGMFGSEETSYLIPDVTVTIQNGKPFGRMNNQNVLSLKISPDYQNLSSQDPDVALYLNQKLSQAMWVIRAVEKRQSTIEQIVNLILSRQSDFFTSASGTLAPLSLREIAQALGAHESTISRAIREKYLLCKRGVFPLKFFCSRRAGTNRTTSKAGHAPSRQSVCSILQDLVHDEDPFTPLSDSRLAAMMAERGIVISRRTVAKYRDQLGIPNAGLRARTTKP